LYKKNLCVGNLKTFVGTEPRDELGEF